MKTCVAFTATVLVIATTADSAWGLAKYLDELPNGSLFSQELGHPDNDSSKNTDFAKIFASAGHSWTAALCAQTFPGSTMTNGAAFGDPCCTWKKGSTPDFTVTAFTTTPGKATVCTSGGSGASTTASGSTHSETVSPATDTPSTTTAAPTTETPAVTTAAPSTHSPSATTATPGTDAPSVTPTTDTPARPGTVSPGSWSDHSGSGWFPRPGGGCKVKPWGGRGKHHGFFRH